MVEEAEAERKPRKIRLEKTVKNELICTRVTSQIKEAVVEEAAQEGLSASEWLRTLMNCSIEGE